jgi:hypothetical protein
MHNDLAAQIQIRSPPKRVPRQGILVKVAMGITSRLCDIGIEIQYYTEGDFAQWLGYGRLPYILS